MINKAGDRDQDHFLLALIAKQVGLVRFSPAF